MVEGANKRKMCFAFNYMKNKAGRNLTSRLYENVRLSISVTISETNKGRKSIAENIRAFNEGRKGKTYEEIYGAEKAAKLKDATRFRQLGKQLTELHCKNISNGTLGKKKKYAPRPNYKPNRKGIPCSESTKTLLRLKNKGKKLTPEQVETRRENALKQWSNKREKLV
jgi:hypothetical protein